MLKTAKIDINTINGMKRVIMTILMVSNVGSKNGIS
jgi:hypothetical protein